MSYGYAPGYGYQILDHIKTYKNSEELLKMKPETVAKKYFEILNIARDCKERIEEDEQTHKNLREEIKEKDAEINRLNNKIKFSGLKKMRLEITYFELECETVLSCGCMCCDECIPNWVRVKKHSTKVFYDYEIDTGEAGYEDDEGIKKGATITGVDSDFDTIEIENVIRVEKDGKVIYDGDQDNTEGEDESEVQKD